MHTVVSGSECLKSLGFEGTCMGVGCYVHVDEQVASQQVPTEYLVSRLNALREAGVSRREISWQMGATLGWVNKMMSVNPHPTVDEMRVRLADVLLSLTARRAVGVWGLGETERLRKEQQHENESRNARTFLGWPVHGRPYRRKP